jgi:hypothetical protein
MSIAWGRGFFRFWILLSVVWISAAIWIQSSPPIPSGPPRFDETSPFLEVVPGPKFQLDATGRSVELKPHQSIYLSKGLK